MKPDGTLGQEGAERITVELRGLPLELRMQPPPLSHDGDRTIDGVEEPFGCEDSLTACPEHTRLELGGRKAQIVGANVRTSVPTPAAGVTTRCFGLNLGGPCDVLGALRIEMLGQADLRAVLRIETGRGSPVRIPGLQLTTA